jgi:hypothetical protein
LGRSRDTAWQLLIRSREAIARFERANAGGNPAELAEARTALESCYAEVKWLVAARKAMKSEKLEATVQKLTTSTTGRRGEMACDSSPGPIGALSTSARAWSLLNPARAAARMSTAGGGSRRRSAEAQRSI